MITNLVLNENIRCSNILEAYYVTDGKSKLKYKSLTEADKNVLGKETVNKLFKSIKSKSLKVNYAGIERSKGDITKYVKYNDLENSIKILKNMYDADPSIAPTEIPKVVRCLDVLKKDKNNYIKAFNEKNEIIILLYTNIVGALIGCTSLLISSTIEYIKTPTGNYRAIFTNKKQNCKNVYIKSIDKFLKLNLTGDLKPLFNTKQLNESFDLSYTDEDDVLNETFFGSMATEISGVMKGGMALPMMGKVLFIIGIAITVLVLCRYLVYFWFFSRTKISDNLLTLSYFVSENAQSIDTTSEKGQKIAERQLKAAEKLKRLSDIIRVDSEKASAKAESEIEQEDKQNRDNQNNSSDSDDDGILLL